LILVVGWDGATWDVARPLLDAGEMPALGGLLARGAAGTLASTLPPVTFPAWSSFMTGVNPGKHGVFDFTRRIPGSYDLAFVSSRDRLTPTVWRLLSDAGRRVAVLGVPATYPPEPINGVMVGGFDSPVATGIDGSFVHPPGFYREMLDAVGPYSVTDFQELRIGPGWHADALAKMLAAIERKTALARWVLARERWDCLMTMFGEADTVSHHFWMFADPRSPRHDPDGARQLGDAVRTVYRRLDAALGELIVAAPAGTTVLVASDHGFGGAGRTAVHLNRWLADQGFLTFRRGAGATTAALARTARAVALRTLPRGIQERVVRRFGRSLARRLEGWSRLGAIDMRRTRAFSEELNYAPSIWLNLRGRDPEGTITPGADYDATAADLTARLLAWRHPETGTPMVAAVHRRDALYSGPAVEHAPDLILELALEDGYSPACLGSTASTGASVRHLHRDEHVGGKGGGMNGSHRGNGMYALAGADVDAGVAADAAIVDVAPTLLRVLGIAAPPWMDGRVLDAVRPAGHALERLAGLDTVAEEGSPASARGVDGDGELWARLAALGYLEERHP
jgi:predicted AlkP superfamily phosphohydrolase/phosphomutase